MKNHAPPRAWLWGRLLIAIAVLPLFTACAAFQIQKELLDPAVYYLNDMDLSVNGKKCIGVCVPQKSNSYEIKIESKQDMDQLVISTCKRTVPIAAAIQSGWFKKKRGYTYLYQPGDMELEQGCSMALWGGDKDSGQHSWARIYFPHDKFTLVAGISCNADPDYGATGSAVCQAMQGQKMKIWFQKKVRLAPSQLLKDEQPKANCQLPASPDGLTWKFNLPNRECKFKFETVAAPYEQFVLYTIGAEQAAIRGD